MPLISSAASDPSTRAGAGAPVYWRVEGSLLELSALRQVGFFTWNVQSFAERWRRRVGMALMTLLRPVAYLAGRKRATRLLYTLLRGVTRDRLDLLGEEYFEYFLKPRLRTRSRRSASSECKAKASRLYWLASRWTMYCDRLRNIWAWIALSPIAWNFVTV